MLNAYVAQILAAIRMSFADRTNFILQLTGMAVNNGFFLLLWVLFFTGFRSVGGWQLRDICLLLGTIMFVAVVATFLIAAGIGSRAQDDEASEIEDDESPFEHWSCACKAENGLR